MGRPQAHRTGKTILFPALASPFALTSLKLLYLPSPTGSASMRLRSSLTRSWERPMRLPIWREVRPAWRNLIYCLVIVKLLLLVSVQAGSERLVTLIL